MTKRVLGHCSRWVQFADPAADVMHPKTRCIWSGAAITGSGSVGKSWELCRHFASDGELTIKLCLGGRIKRIVADLINGTPFEVLADLLPALQGHDKVHALHVLDRCDLLVMVGDSDLLTPVGHSYEIVRHTPSAELVILPGVGHMLTLEAVDDVNKHLRALVERVG